MSTAVNPWLAFPDGRPSASLTRQLRAAHERLVTRCGLPNDSLPLDNAVRSVVRDSWRRSLGSGVDPDGSAPPVELLDDDLLAYRAAHPLAPVMPVIRRLLVQDAEADQMIVAVTDAEGRMLWVEGDSRLRSRAAGMHFVEGARWAEDVVGTNAPGTALAVDHAVQIYGSEHFRRPEICSRCSQRSSASTAATVARTSVSTCGLATWSPPVTSIAPSSAPVTGSCTGAAAQLHGWTVRR